MSGSGMVMVHGHSVVPASSSSAGSANVSRPMFRGDVSSVCCCGGGLWFLYHMDLSRLFPRVFVLSERLLMCPHPLLRRDVRWCVVVVVRGSFIIIMDPSRLFSSCICPHVPSPQSNPASVSRPLFSGDVSSVCCCGGGLWFLYHMDLSRLFSLCLCPQ